MYLYICDYLSDAELYQTKYVCNRVDSESKTIDKTMNISGNFHEYDVDKLITSLYLRVSSINVHLYQLSPVKLDSVLNPKELKKKIQAARGTVESFLSYLLVQLRVIYKKTLASISNYMTW